MPSPARQLAVLTILACCTAQRLHSQSPPTFLAFEAVLYGLWRSRATASGFSP